MVKNAKRVCVAICFGSSNNLTGIIVCSYRMTVCKNDSHGKLIIYKKYYHYHYYYYFYYY